MLSSMRSLRTDQAAAMLTLHAFGMTDRAQASRVVRGLWWECEPARAAGGERDERTGTISGQLHYLNAFIPMSH